MRSTFETPYDEYFARLCINSVFQELGFQLDVVSNDPPDLEDREKGISVEVVRATTEYNSQLHFAYSLTKGESRTNVPKKLDVKISKGNGGLIADEKNNVVGVRYPIVSKPYELIENALMKKTEILNTQRYPEYKENCLFVYNSGRFCFEKGLKKSVKELKLREKFNRTFNKIFIYCDHDVFLYDIGEDVVYIKKIDDEIIEQMKEGTLKEIGRHEEYLKKAEFIMNVNLK